MGYFHRSLRRLPGLRLDLSKSGLSLSFGVLGARLGLSRKFMQTTLSQPGTGLSYIWRNRRK